MSRENRIKEVRLYERLVVVERECCDKPGVISTMREYFSPSSASKQLMKECMMGMVKTGRAKIDPSVEGIVIRL